MDPGGSREETPQNADVKKPAWTTTQIDLARGKRLEKKSLGTEIDILMPNGRHEKPKNTLSSGTGGLMDTSGFLLTSARASAQSEEQKPH